MLVCGGEEGRRLRCWCVGMRRGGGSDVGVWGRGGEEAQMLVCGDEEGRRLRCWCVGMRRGEERRRGGAQMLDEEGRGEMRER